MKHIRTLPLLLLVLVAAAGSALAHSQTAEGEFYLPVVVQPVARSDVARALYIVQLSAPPLALYDGSLPGLAPTNPQTLGEMELAIDAPASRDYLSYLAEQQALVIAQAEALIGRPLDVRFSYSFAFAGFAAEMTPAEAARIAALPDVRQVTPDAMRNLHTDVGPGWIGAPGVWDGSATGAASQGEDVIIGIIDTGLNIDHPSFADPGPIDGYNYTNPFGAGIYKGLCATKPAQYRCNDKLLGYYIFTGETNEDTDGHGSHTASTAAGNRVNALLDVAPTNPFSYAPAISGVAPHAHLIAYDACIDGSGCPLTALTAAIDQAVADGVDVINYSIGGPSSDPWIDIDAQAFLGAVAAGVIPAVSAGNDGPGASTVGSPADAPWVLTVGASTHTRSSQAALVNLNGGASPPPADMKGLALTAAYGPAPIVYAGKFGDPKCQTPFPANTWTHGEIVVCERGGNARTAKGTAVKKGGARGMVLVNTQAGESLAADAHIIPAVHLSKADGDALKAWLSTPALSAAEGPALSAAEGPALSAAEGPALSAAEGPALSAAEGLVLSVAEGLVLSVAEGGSGHMATIQTTQIHIDPAHADIMADFSSRGPLTNAARDVIKPDVTAPGVDILAAYRSGSGPAGDAEPWMDEFNFLSGTSMSSPHVAGAAALLHSLHPTWTPSEVKSALMTTAIVAGVRKEDGSTPAGPFDRGGGRIDVSRAANAGMVLDVTPDQFNAANPTLGGEPKTLNLPSLADNACPAAPRAEPLGLSLGTKPRDEASGRSLGTKPRDEACSWTRSVRNPTNRTLTFAANYTGVGSATITPSVLSLGPGQTASFVITLDVSAATKGVWAFGLLNWREQANHAPDAHFPVAVIPVTPVARVRASPASLRSDQAPGTVTTRTLTIANTGAAVLNWQIKEDASGNAIALDASLADQGLAFEPDATSLIFKVDDGRSEWALGLPGGGQFLWFNRFTPDPANFPISLEKVQVLFEFEVEVGALVDIYVYEDKDGDGNPGTGAVHRASLKSQAVQSNDGRTFSTFTFPTPVQLNGPGDILIGVVNRTAGVAVGKEPASIDANSFKRRRSWFGSYGGPPADPPILPAPQNWGIIDDLDLGQLFQDGNWMIRGLGTGRGPCDTLADVPWLKDMTPASGSTPVGGSASVQITLDATGLAAGDYKASICIDSNDPATPRMVIPVEMNVDSAPAIQMLPAGLQARLAPGKQTVQPLTIRNIGGQTLNWAVSETAPLAQTAGGLSSAALAPAIVLHDQTDLSGSNFVLSQFFPDLNKRVRGADDFVVPAADGGWKVEQVAVQGMYGPGEQRAPNFNVVIYANRGGLPGAEVYRAAGLVAVSDQNGAVVFKLSPPALLPPGTYWLSVEANMVYNPDRQLWVWLTRDVQNGFPYAWEDPDGLLQTPCVTWKPGASACGIGGGIDPDLLFRLEGVKGAPACANTGAIGWLNVSPANGATAPGQSSTAQARFDSTGLAPGLYIRSLCVSNNSPNTPFVLVPVQLEVTASLPLKLFLPRLLR